LTEKIKSGKIGVMEKKPTAIITGASTGLGFELSVRLAAEGYFVIGVARHQPQDSRWIKLEKAGCVRFVEADVSDQETVSEVISIATESGNYSLLINCAGQGVFGAADSYSAQDVSDVLSANLIGLILFCTKSLPAFVSTSGTIVNIMSTASQVGRANETIYCAAKWGARGYTEALRIELKGKPVRIFAVYPGGMKTPFWQKAKGHNVNPEKFMDPAEVADELVFALRQKRTLQVTDIFLNRA
jgi:short-subunit dehydrogenase